MEFIDQIDIVNTKLNNFCGNLYQLRTILNEQQLNQPYQTYVKITVVQYGVLIYRSTFKSNIDKNGFNINRLIRVWSFKKKFESIYLLRKKRKKYNIQELHLYEIFCKMIRGKCEFLTLSKSITSDELFKIYQRVKKLIINPKKHHKFSIVTSTRKLYNCLTNFYPTFFKID